jgi:hypothetical protein
MWLLMAKYLSTAAVVVVVSELAKRSDRLGAFVGALPLVTLLVLVWLHVEHQPVEKLAAHARYTFWYVLPTLPMFWVLPTLLMRLSFPMAMTVGIALTVILFGVTALLARSLGINLL